MELRERCWEFPGSRKPKGYGMAGVDGKTRYVHRIVYEIYHGPIPAGWPVDHLCHNPPCYNPSHLEAVPPVVNVSRQRAHRGGRRKGGENP